ncbi:unnamed protein product [Lampetra planeri]
MEGVLYKWTNYYNGWQPRWFVLDGGVLSYYDHKEDVRKGSKGSLKMAVCEIQGSQCAMHEKQETKKQPAQTKEGRLSLKSWVFKAD